MSDQIANQSAAPRRSTYWKKLLVLAAVAAALLIGYTQFRDTLTLDYLAERESELRKFQADHPILVYGLAFVVYVAVTGLSLPGATVLTLTYGWYFDFVAAVILVSFASTSGATVAMVVSRYLLRDTIYRRFGDRLAGINQALEREGAFFLFTLRLIPAIPFFVINVVMGLTPIRVTTYWWVSQLGMLPATLVYIYAGYSVPDLQTLAEHGVGGILTVNLVIAFILLGTFPLLVRFIMKRVRAKKLNIPAAEAEKQSPDVIS